MNFKYAILLVFCIIFANCKKQEDKRHQENNSLNTYIELGGSRPLPYAARAFYNKKALSAIGIKTDSLSRKQLIDVGWNYFYMHNLKELRHIADLVYKASAKENSNRDKARAFRFYGLFFEKNSINDSAFYYYDKAGKIFEKEGDLKELCRNYQDKAIVQLYVNDFLGSDQSLIKALKLAQKEKLRLNEYIIYCSLAGNSFEMNDFGKAIQYYQKALRFYEANNLHNEYNDAVSCIGNIAINQSEDGNFREALATFDKALAEHELAVRSPTLYCSLLDNKARTKLKLHEIEGVEQMFAKATQIRDSLNIDEGREINSRYLSEYYMEIGEQEKALSSAHNALAISKSFFFPKAILASLKQLVKVDPENALRYNKDYIRMSDSMQQRERESRNKFSKIAYETEEIAGEKNLAVHQKWIFLAASILIAVIVLLLFVIATLRIRQKELSFIREQQKKDEEIYHLVHAQRGKLEEGRQMEKERIAQELHDGIMNRLASTRLNLHSMVDTQVKIPEALSLVSGIEDIEDEIRNIAEGLDAGYFAASSDFIELISALIAEQQTLFKTKCTFTCDADINWDLIDNSRKIHIYRILQEALSNSNKHAKAKQINIKILMQDGNLLLEVKDDGIGIITASKKEGIGMDNMRIRTEKCGGSFKVFSGKGKGMLIRIAFPVVKSIIIMTSIFFAGCSENSTARENRKLQEVDAAVSMAANRKLTPARQLSYNVKALNLLSALPADSLLMKKMTVIADELYHLNEFKLLNTTCQILMKKAEGRKSKYYIAQAHRWRGIYYESLSINDSAFYYYLKAGRIFTRLRDNTAICENYQDQAQVQYYTNDYAAAEKSLLKGLRIANREKNVKQQFYCLTTLGTISYDLNDHMKSLSYHKQAQRLVLDAPSKFPPLSTAVYMNDLGRHFAAVHNEREALKYFEAGLQVKDLRYISPESYTRLLDNYGHALFKMHDYRLLPGLYLKAAAIRGERNLQNGSNFNRLYLSEYYAAKKDTAKAIQLAKEAFDLSKSFRAPNDMLYCLRQLLKFENGSALPFAQRYIAISDSMQNMERESRNKFAKIEYETEEITNEMQEAIRQKKIFIGICILVFAIGILALIIVMQRNRQKEIIFLQGQQKSNEEIYQLIQERQDKMDEGRNMEKKRFAAELKDRIINRLSGVRRSMTEIIRSDDPELVNKLLPCISSIQEIEREVRELAHGINNEVFSSSDSFIAVLEELIDRQRQQKGTSCHLEIDKGISWESIDSTKKIHLYRILQEALSNISAHAEARQVIVSIMGVPNGLLLEIYDDGKGFNTKRIKKGIGLFGMQLRVKAFQGNLEIISKEGEATTVRITIPYAAVG